MTVIRIVRVFALLFCAATSAAAQGGDVFQRARRLVNDGDAKTGRALVDSALQAASAGSPAYAEALYWRGVLAEDGDAARTDLLRVAIEFPYSPRAPEALLRVAQLEFSRGDRATAQRHLERLEREHANSPVRAAGRYWMGRLLLEDSKPMEACAALRDARQSAAKSDIELINQIDFYARPCAAIAFSAKAQADSAAAADSARKVSASEKKGSSSAGKWSVQVAAYGSREEALVLAKKLSKRGYDARVTSDKPWRVRVGHYATRGDASDVAKKLSSKGNKAAVVEAEGH